MPRKTASMGSVTTQAKAAEGCTLYLNEHNRHSMCMTCLSPWHFQESHHDNPCSPFQSLASYRDRKKRTGLPQLPQSVGGTPTQSHPVSIVESKASQRPSRHGSSPSLLFLPGMGPVLLSTPEREGGMIQLTWTSPLRLRIRVALSTPQLLRKRGWGQSQWGHPGTPFH